MHLVSIKYYLRLFLKGILNSYSQIFFSNNYFLAGLLLFVSFFDLGAGISGVLAIFISQLTALAFHFDHKNITNGTYTYNSAMVGMALGGFYQLNISLIALIIIAGILTFFLSIWFMHQLANKGLPFLSISFLIVIWLFVLGAKNFSALQLNEKNTLTFLEYFPSFFLNVTELIANIPFSNFFYLYFRSLGAIIFQYNDFAGILIAIGLLFQSRISFLLSIVGFSFGYGFYQLMEADFSQLIYSYIGFNFILTSIALGGFFIVSNTRSFVLLLFCIPVIAILISGLSGLFTYLGLPLYSLPFNLVVWIVLFAIGKRSYSSKLNLVAYQHFSPEKNHYKFYNAVERFSKMAYYSLDLPIIGKWRISQGHNGTITHKEDYKYAWDFDIIDEQGKTYHGSGVDLMDYYCYNMPITAPLFGTVIAIIDGVEDNAIGNVDIQHNWGNTIIIKHDDFFYSKLSHLKINSIEVKVGDYVSKGQVIAKCGSSGRSPEPHLHYQLQATPYIGSKTLLYPIGYYLTNQNNTFKFHSYNIPKQSEIVCNVISTPLIFDAFNFIPGKKLQWHYSFESKSEIITWEVGVTIQNQAYLYCPRTKSTAFFVNNGTEFYFTDFDGNKNSLLHNFYLSAHKIILGYYEGITVKDKLSISELFPVLLKSVHDLTAPFYHYLKADYSFSFAKIDNIHNPTTIKMNTSCEGIIFNKKISTINYSLEISNADNAIITFIGIQQKFKAVLCSTI